MLTGFQGAGCSRRHRPGGSPCTAARRSAEHRSTSPCTRVVRKAPCRALCIPEALRAACFPAGPRAIAREAPDRGGLCRYQARDRLFSAHIRREVSMPIALDVLRFVFWQPGSLVDRLRSLLHGPACFTSETFHSEGHASRTNLPVRHLSTVMGHTLHCLHHQQGRCRRNLHHTKTGSWSHPTPRDTSPTSKSRTKCQRLCVIKSRATDSATTLKCFVLSGVRRRQGFASHGTLWPQANVRGTSTGHLGIARQRSD